MDEKTNVMRLLEQKNIPYTAHYYGTGEAMSGVEVAKLLNRDVDQVYKTLVTTAGPRKFYVFMIPAAEELDLKKAARAVGEKSLEMLKQKDLLPNTGYIHGGCSPIGMKKLYPTTIHEDAILYDTILFSAGKIGCQVELNIEQILPLVPYTMADLIK
ncbi:MAG: Cys-tRNA(Pro) deacylase [Clostridiales bacterium]|nr:Cys-tRNA(Pro) deacylase [Clostridiales bacterium]